MRYIFVLRCPLYNSISDEFQLAFEDVVSGSLESVFQSYHQVDISLYLMQATIFYLSREQVSLTPS